VSFAELLTVGSVLAGCFFFLTGTLGLLRFPDTLTRLHALTKADNLGLGLVVLGLSFQAGSPAAILKLLLLWLFVLLASATTAYLIGGATAEASGPGSDA
jgi:multicomponent Na+:H+ antiporter subunit G